MAPPRKDDGSLKVAIALFAILAGVASSLGAWNLALSFDNSGEIKDLKGDIRELRTRIELLHK